MSIFFVLLCTPQAHPHSTLPNGVDWAGVEQTLPRNEINPTHIRAPPYSALFWMLASLTLFSLSLMETKDKILVVKGSEFTLKSASWISVDPGMCQTV